VGNLFVTWGKLQAVGAHSGSVTKEEYDTSAPKPYPFMSSCSCCSPVGCTRQNAKEIDFCTVRILRESPCWVGGGCRLWCGTGGMCTGGWTKGLLLVENSMTH
jgi:hypothetical protein